MNQARLPRSYLLVPGNRPERFDKALASGADAVIIDLEDAVPPDQKETARATVSGRLTSSKPVVLRINAVETPWFADDLAICRNAGRRGHAGEDTACRRLACCWCRHRVGATDRVSSRIRPTGRDSPSTSINEPDEGEAEAQHARRCGFGAKLCIHPSQVKPVNRSFSPDELRSHGLNAS